MRKSVFLLLFLVWAFAYTSSTAQNREFPNAVHARLNFFDYGTLNDEDFKLGEGFEVGYFRNIAPFLNVGVPFKLGLAKLPGTSGNTVTTSLDLVFHLENIRDDAKISPYAFAGGGYFLEEFENGHLQFPFGAGVNFRISKYAFINTQVEYRKSAKDLRDNIQLGLGFVYLLHKAEPKPQPPADRDRDGVPDISDQCPDVPGPAAAVGCPDRDNDGVADKDDQCPDQAGTAATNGCPDTDEDGVADKDDDCPTVAGTLKGCPDSDRDGVADHEDECPDEAGTVKGCPDSDYDGIPNKDDKCPREAGPPENNGCPQITDTDGDGVADEVDPCPTTAGTANGCPDADGDGVADKDDPCPNMPGKAKGCPDADGDGVPDKDDPCPDAAGTFAGCPDTDGDGVPDDKDKCPKTAGPATNSGCPEVKKETRERLDYVTKNIQFETGRADLKISSFKILDELVGIMDQYPDYKLEIRGYTDDVGRSEKNLQLSKDRARACYDYLAYRGIDAKRLRSRGFGEAKPIATNKTEEGREKNRRVEFELVLDYEEKR